MSVVSVQAKSFILALFIRDDGERFLLGDNGYDFVSDQLHFAGNSIENDEVAKQGADGVMLAGQVRRSSVQSFRGYIGDGAQDKETIEQMRKDFIAFFAKGHHFRVVYVDCNRNAWQRKGGYLVDAPEVKELWQIHPEYSVGLNFEDVNYYSYNEDAQGDEILANVVNVPVSTASSGGLEWDSVGAVSEYMGIDYDSETAEVVGKSVTMKNAVEAPLESFEIYGETSQNGTPTPSAPVPVQTVTGENVVKICGKNLFDKDNANVLNAYFALPSSTTITSSSYNRTLYVPCDANTTYTFQAMASNWIRQVGYTTTTPAFGVSVSGITNLEGNATSITITTDATAKYLVFRFWHQYNSTETYQQALDSIQIELGSTATEYQPYQEQGYEVNLDIGGGKNLLKYSWPYTAGYYDGSGNWSDDWRFACYNNYFEVEPNTTYSFSSSHSNTNMAILWFDENKNWISRAATTSATSASGTSPATAKYARLQVRYETNTGISYIILSSMQLQFEQGSVSSYEPFVCYELCKIGTYQDYIYKSGGKWYVHKEVDRKNLNGSEDWDLAERSGSSNGVFYVDYSKIGTVGAKNNGAFSNYARFISGFSYLVGQFDTHYSQWRFYAPNNTITLNEWKINLGAAPLVLYYLPATPTDTEITNEALIAQLETLLNTATTYAGVNNITTITPNERGTLEISYYTKYDPIYSGGGYVWEGGTIGGPTTIINNSITNVEPVWTVYGPMTNPILENTTTGEQIEYVGTIGEGQTLTVDMGEQTALLNGVNVISDLVGSFMSLAPGANVLVFSCSNGNTVSKIGWSEIVG